MADIIQLRDYHLRRVTKEAAERKGELVEFAKGGGPTVEGADKYQGVVCPEGIDGLMYETSLGYVPTPWDVG